MRNLNLEAAIWNLFTSPEFFEAASRECGDTLAWFGKLALSRKVGNFGRNNQIFDKFAQWQRDFRRGAELAALEEYEMLWDVAMCVPGSIRGMMEQPLHSWMSEAEYNEFEKVKISRIMTYAGQIESALRNAMVGSVSFFDPDPDYPEGKDDDNAFPGKEIVTRHETYADYYEEPLFWKLPDPLPEYSINMSISCDTGDEVPWTGVWYPNTGLEHHSLTFAIKGKRMQPAYRVIKTAEEFRAEGDLCAWSKTVAVATSWNPVIAIPPPINLEVEVRAKAGEPCPKTGIWRPTDPGAASRRYEAGKVMAQSSSPYGITIWLWETD